MKPGAPLKRTKPLRPGPPPQRKTPMPRAASPAQGSQVPRQGSGEGGGVRKATPAKRKPQSPEERRARAALKARSRGVCEWHLTHPATDYSHRIHESQGGPWDVANASHLCHALHMALHDQYRRLAEEAGLILRSTADYLTEPVWLLLHGGWVRLLPDGEADPLVPQPPAPALTEVIV